MKKKDYLILGIIALSFFWTGSAYISVAYRLMESYSVKLNPYSVSFLV